MKITKITWNWQAGFEDYSDTCEEAEVGINGVRSIEKSLGGTLPSWNINYDSKVIEVFNPNVIIKSK